MKKRKTIMAFCLFILLISGTLVSCTSLPPKILQLPNSEQLIPFDYSNLKSSLGKTVRWGGTVLEIKNFKDSSQITILASPLDNQARPITSSQNNSRRFIAEFDYFIEPNNYNDKREITIIGKLARIEKGKIGEFIYDFPVVLVTKHALWQNQRFYENDPYYYGGHYLGYGYNPYYYSYFWDYNRHHHYPHFY